MTKRFLPLLLALTMLSCDLFSLFTPATTPTPTALATATHTPRVTLAPAPTRTPTRVIVVAFDSLYLREGPGMQYAASNEVLKWGNKLVFEDECRMDARGWWWLRVRVDERSGWVAQAYITPTVCR